MGNLKTLGRSAVRPFVLTAVAAASSLALLGPACAALTIDLTPVTDAGTAVATVGGAVFAVMVGIAVYKWIRRAL